MYNLPYAYTYALSVMRRISLVLMHILIQLPSPYKSSFSYKTSDDAETHSSGPFDIQLVYEDMPQESGPYQCRAAHISTNGYANGYRSGDEYGYGYGRQVYIYTSLLASRDQSINKSKKHPK